MCVLDVCLYGAMTKENAALVSLVVLEYHEPCLCFESLCSRYPTSRYGCESVLPLAKHCPATFILSCPNAVLLFDISILIASDLWRNRAADLACDVRLALDNCLSEATDLSG